jgi:CDP-diacylglycerol pyrophosphatase
MKKASIAALLSIFVAGTVALVVAYQRNALRRIVQDNCVPGFRNHANPAPCIRVVLGSTSGEDNGYAILHDRKGGAHFLLIPTRTLPGIESAALLDPTTPDYVAAAWKNRDVLDRWLGRTLPRDAVGLAINPRTSRSQDQLHVHIECIGAMLQQALRTQADAIGTGWTPITVAGHRLEARRILGDDFKLANPIRQLASASRDARGDRSVCTLIVAGHTFAAGPGVVALVGTDALGGETLLDAHCETSDPERRP